MKRKIMSFDEAKDLITKYGLDGDAYIAENVKRFMNSSGEPDDDSLELWYYYQDCLKIIVDKGLESGGKA